MEDIVRVEVRDTGKTGKLLRFLLHLDAHDDVPFASVCRGRRHLRGSLDDLQQDRLPAQTWRGGAGA